MRKNRKSLQHLSDEDIAYLADILINGDQNKAKELAPEEYTHVNSCAVCMGELEELVSVLVGVDNLSGIID